MNRLTEHSEFCINSAVPSENLGDLCLKMEFCDEFDFCEGCPVKRIMDRLCEYEDTELEPKEIVEMKKAANIKRCQRKGIVGVPKNGNRTIIQRVSRRGLIINGEYFYDEELSHCYYGQKVKIVIKDNVATVFDLGYKAGQPIAEFDLQTNQGSLIEYGGTADSIRKGIEIIKSEQAYISRINSVNDAIKYLAENNAFSLKNGELFLDNERIPGFKNGEMIVCNSKNKTILRILEAINGNGKKY